MTRPSRRTTGYILVIGAIVCWSFNGPLAQLVFTAGVDPRQLAALRVAAIAVVLGPIAAWQLWRHPVPRGILLRVALLYGVIGLMLAQWVYFETLTRLSVGLALIIIYTAPLLVALWMRWRHGEALRRRVVGWMTLAFVGVAGSVAGAADLGTLPVLGIGLAALCAVLYAGQIVLAGHGGEEIGAIPRLAAAAILATAVWTITDRWWRFPPGTLGRNVTVPAFPDVQLPVWLILADILVLGTIVGYGAMTAGVPRLGPSAVATTSMAEPALASAVAWALLADQLTVVQIIFGATALVAITRAERARSAPQRAAAKVRPWPE